MPSFDSATYPYSLTPSANNTLRGAEKIPKQILLYLLDLPDAAGYTPRDDNRRPRVRLSKYLYYDGEDPLLQPLPTPAQKLSMLFDPTEPDINTDEQKAKHPKGYRLFWQHVTKESNLEEKSYIKCYIGRVFSPRPYITTIGVYIDIWCGSNLETNIVTDVESRSFAIEQAIVESLANVNFTGIGAVSFLRSDHTNNGSVPVYTDGSLLGRSLHFSISWSDADNGIVTSDCESC